jgi:hypothetical protein
MERKIDWYRLLKGLFIIFLINFGYACFYSDELWLKISGLILGPALCGFMLDL